MPSVSAAPLCPFWPKDETFQAFNGGVKGCKNPIASSFFAPKPLVVSPPFGQLEVITL